MTHTARGSVLSGAEIALRSDVSQKPLIEGFTRDGLRGAGYDLHVGDTAIDQTGRKVELGDDRPLIRLEPGESAVVRTKECLSLPPDIAANLTLKTGIAAKGILLLSGMLVDPRYEGHLHLLVSNMGQQDFNILPNQPIAALQFLVVSGPAETPTNNPTSDLGRRFENATGEPPVAFLEDMRQLRREFNEVAESAVKTHDQTRLMVTVAISVLAATIIGESLSFLLSFAASHDFLKVTHRLWPHTNSGKVAVAAVAILIAVSIWSLAKVLVAKLQPRAG